MAKDVNGKAKPYQSNRELGRPERPTYPRAVGDTTHVSGRGETPRADRYQPNQWSRQNTDWGWGGGGWGGGYGGGRGMNINLGQGISLNLGGLLGGFGGGGHRRGRASTEGTTHWRASGPEGPGYYTTYNRGRTQVFAGGDDEGYGGGYRPRGGRERYYAPPQPRYYEEDPRDRGEWREPSRDMRRGRSSGGGGEFEWNSDGQPVFRDRAEIMHERRIEELQARGRQRSEGRGHRNAPPPQQRRQSGQPASRPEASAPPVATGQGVAIPEALVNDMIQSGGGLSTTEFETLIAARAADGNQRGQLIIPNERLLALHADLQDGVLQPDRNDRTKDYKLLGRDGKPAKPDDATVKEAQALVAREIQRRGLRQTSVAPAPTTTTSPAPATSNDSQKVRSEVAAIQTAIEGLNPAQNEALSAMLIRAKGAQNRQALETIQNSLEARKPFPTGDNYAPKVTLDDQGVAKVKDAYAKITQHAFGAGADGRTARYAPQTRATLLDSMVHKLAELKKPISFESPAANAANGLLTNLVLGSDDGVRVQHTLADTGALAQNLRHLAMTEVEHRPEAPGAAPAQPHDPNKQRTLDA